MESAIAAAATAHPGVVGEAVGRQHRPGRVAAEAGQPAAAQGGAGARVAPLQAALLDDPVAFLSAEHARQTVLLGHLERVACAPLGRAARGLAAMLLGWLTAELPIHIEDEERSLYPRLAAHDASGVLPTLQARHREDRNAVGAVLAGLRCVAAGEEPDGDFTAAALAFVSGHRRHLALEEEAVTPLAHRVLAPEALSALADEMARRRS
ncbi:Hemerythrin HHE cation binding domain-containing protein [Belnapia rosea]|uniref:Hemerythrin HHE cation binding domain-containing protein n=1 Tax=Belnapia rosea TaxID=938405 RepID=A0A1G7BG16_9PROT|nr:Hemerythrin HHE cation binding domain-containing protein [Belnapia rosea]